MLNSKKISFLSGVVCGLSFAPFYFFPGIFGLSVLCAQIFRSKRALQALKLGGVFGFGYFLVSLYWISFGVSVYIESFWWAIPLALFGIPSFLALFISLHSVISWKLRKHHLYHFFFCCSWVFIEWITSFIFTGFPWCLLGYAFCISDIMIQSVSLVGVIGLSFVSVYTGSSFFCKKLLINRVLVICCVFSAMMLFGHNRLSNNPTKFSETKIRIIQPSVPQLSKWDSKTFWKNLDKHISLSKLPGNPDIIIWSESALTVPYYHKQIYNHLLSALTNQEQVLILGSIDDNAKKGNDYKIFSSLIAINKKDGLLFNYHKSHLVPFGEYVPFSKFFPIKKLTHGILDYSAGTRKIVYLEPVDLYIHPMICYESIFSNEVRISNLSADCIINVTNDAWYGVSSGPYQHFEISRMRAVENGLPMVRATNNGISGIVDPCGRVVASLDINESYVIDSLLPFKLGSSTLFSQLGPVSLLLVVVFVLVLQSTIYCSILKS